MKTVGVVLAHLTSSHARRNLRILFSLLLALVLVVALYSTIFHVLMERESQEHSWPSSVYWTLVTMTTLGFGDITFESDIGRVFSLVVLLSGTLFILVLLPFTFIQFLYVPLVEARRRERAPRSLPPRERDHVLLTRLGPIEDELIARLQQARHPYAVLVDGLEEGLRLHDLGYRVMVGPLDDPATYRAARVEAAALVVTTGTDTMNTNVAFTVREISSSVRVIATANSPASVDILELSGCDRVLQLGDMLGKALVRRVLGADFRSKVIGEFGEVLIAEAVAPAALVGRPLEDTGLRMDIGIIVAGVWDRGRFSIAGADTVLSPTNIVVLAGSREQLDAYDEAYGVVQPAGAPVLIVGGGRVGRAAGAALREMGSAYRIVEQREDRVHDPEVHVRGNAAELEVLEAAGIAKSPAVLVTTHDDDTNVYLTIYCRRLRPDIEIIARANLDRNISTLHRAGADAVLSYASTGATAIWNELSPHDVLQLAEGLEVFSTPVPDALAGRTLAESHVRARTGCNVLAVVDEASCTAGPPASTVMPRGGSLVLIGDDEAVRRFRARYGSTRLEPNRSAGRDHTS